MVIVLLQTEYV